jgi:hypothetical protein
MLYEAHAGHPVGPSISENDNVDITRASGNVDFHHSVFANLSHRIPEYNHSPARWINNITFNYSFYALLALGATQTDVIGNIWDFANLVPSHKFPINSSDGNWPGSLPGTPSFYVADNIGPSKSAANADQYAELCAQVTGENGNEIGPFPASWRRAVPLPASNACPIMVDDAATLAIRLLPNVGNSQRLDANGAWVSHRDTADARIIRQIIQKSSGGFWPNSATNAGATSYPAPLPDWQDQPIAPGTPYQSSQHDGLPDAWKQKMGLDTGKPQNNVVLPDGYTAIEWFLAGRTS